MNPNGGMAVIPAVNTILSFVPDDRFTTVQFDGYRDDRCVVSLTLPFIGWAVIVDWIQGSEYGTRMGAVGLSEHGEPITAYMIGQSYSLEEGKVIQVKLTPAYNSEIAESPRWPDLRDTL